MISKVENHSYGRTEIDNDTWEIVDLPREKKVVICKWAFTVQLGLMEPLKDTRLG